jgi:hypothetical protein
MRSITKPFAVAQRADGVRAAAGDDVGFAALGADLFGHLFQFGVHVAAGRDIAQLAAHQPVQQHIARAHIVDRIGLDPLFQDDLAGHAVDGRCGGRLAHVVRLHGALGHQGVGAGLQGRAQQEFQFAGLVAAAGQAGAVVALHPELGLAAERLAQPGHGLQRRGQMGEAGAWEASEMHGRLLRGRVSLASPARLRDGPGA